MAYSSLDDKDHRLCDSDLPGALGGSLRLWEELLSEISERFNPLSVDWGYSGKKWGWTLRLKQKKRMILYMTPRGDHFVAGFALGQKAVDAAHASDLPQSRLDLIDGSQKYAEGRAVRLDVRAADDVRAAIRIASIKMDN